MKQASAKNQKGYIALIAVLIISAVTLGVALSLNSTGIGETDTGLLLQESAQSQSLADSCMQEALLRLKRDTAFVVGGLNNDFGSCTIQVIGQGNNRAIDVVSDVKGIQRHFEAQIVINSGIVSVSSWTELTK